MNVAPGPGEVRLLLVEDVATSAEIAKAALTDDPLTRFLYAHVTTLADARTLLRNEDFEVVLLDLGLPDSAGLATLDAVRVTAPEVAIVALTALEFEDMALAALRRGADDYLYKGEFDGALLVRSIRHALERRRALNELEGTRHRRNLARTLRALTRLRGLRSTPIREEGVEGNDSPALRESDPEGFSKLTLAYGDIARDVVEETIDPSRRAERLWEISAVLMDRRADAADVVDLHSAALTRRLAGLGPDQAAAYADAGRALALDLMGLTAVRYRNRQA